MKDHERQHLSMRNGMFRHVVAVVPAVMSAFLTCTTACRHADIPSENPEVPTIDWFQDSPPIDITALTRTNLTEIVIANRVTQIQTS